jgi:NAD(P)-dependent dehydrogenase (short-subunit alcohol dehydrogenase family)
MASGNDCGTLIVTGASRGIGAAIARMASERGYAVAVNFATGEAEARSLVEQIASAGGRAYVTQADVSREEDVIRLFETAEKKLGPIRVWSTTPPSPADFRAWNP